MLAPTECFAQFDTARKHESMWKLIIDDDEGQRTTVPLTRDEYSIGRTEGNTIRLTERNVSRHHARVQRAEGTAPYVIIDNESYNGVIVNGKRIASGLELHHGDLIQIGDYRIVLQDDAISLHPPHSGASATTDPIKSTLPAPDLQRGTHLLERPDRLVMLTGPTPGAEFPLTADRITIGRSEDAAISVNHNSVSRHHAEIHALGEGRFEIVDKGSSNGVRVNGADLRRGIIEAGDMLELGDVRLRFVGAGQVFLSTVGDGRGVALFERPSRWSGRSASGVVFWALGILILVAVGAGGAWFLRRRALASAATTTVERSPRPAAVSEPEALPWTTRVSDPPDTPGAASSESTSVDMDARPLTSGRAPWGSYDTARRMALRGDRAGARTMLEPRVLTGKAPPEEVLLLMGICESEADKVCTKKLHQLYP